MKDILFHKFAWFTLSTFFLSIICFTSQAWAQSSCQCHWYGEIRQICQNQTSGWGWENNQTCIGINTCSDQWGDGGLVGDCGSSSSSSSSSSSGSGGESCAGVNEYPEWTARDWAGGPYNHAAAGDQMVYQNTLYRANWYTTTVPGSDASWTTWVLAAVLAAVRILPVVPVLRVAPALPAARARQIQAPVLLAAQASRHSS